MPCVSFRNRVLLPLLLVVSSLAVPPGLSAFEFSVGAGAKAQNFDLPAAGLFPQFDISLAHQAARFGFFADLYVTNDGSVPMPDGQQLGFAFIIRNSGISYRDGPFSVTIGKLRQDDIVRSPYSLFISSNGNDAVSARVRYSGDVFFFETRWVQLNYNSALYRVLKSTGEMTSSTDPDTTVSLDRGLAFKYYGFRLGDFRFAYEDATVYTGRAFDAAYFVNPVPSFWIQYSGVGAPWSQTKPWYTTTGDDANYIAGFMADWTVPGTWAYGQILIDDMSPYFWRADNAKFHYKLAASAGGTHEFDFGTLGFYAALATKYTFEPSGQTATLNYGYTYYPDTTYGSETAILRQSNSIGYINGENNLAFQATFSRPVGPVLLDSSLEFMLTGEQSPANSYGGYASAYEDTSNLGTHLLDDAVLEKKLILRAKGTWTSGNLTLALTVAGGYVWNELALANSASATYNVLVYKPSETCRPLAAMALTGTWRFPVGGKEST